MNVTILGCGSAAGVPVIGNNWGSCDPRNPKNNRTRVSLLIEEEEAGAQSKNGEKRGEVLLFDTSPDMREQLLRVNAQNVTAIFYTHAHADHTLGIDNIRSLNWLTGRPMPLYADEETLCELRERFSYIFEQPPETNRFVRPSVEPHILRDGETLTRGSLRISSFRQTHGQIHSRGFRINDFAYSTDVNDLDDHAFEILKGVKAWVVGAIREKPHHTHAHVERALEWIARVKPQRAYLTHMDSSLDYETLKAKLPPGVEPAYDGMVLSL